ncbi:LysE family translocator [uncultured Desulfuromusa sp.]|uniref:LysE family translocator n=1 Tax=uncultured Desulfuromusa sp. TaxID=219183 RepID=UPI002AA93EC5|nr:LysE family translocator [uncultured Desulfuromusa sp.]
MNYETLLIYFVVSFFYITSPGPAIVLAILNGLRTDMKTVAVASLGNILGLFILSTASMLGLGILLTTSATIFMIAKTIGALYLIYLGVKCILNGQSLNVEKTNPTDGFKKRRSSYFYEAFFLAVTNPKPILFFTAIFPQFLDLETPVLPQFMIMTSLFLVISFSSLCTYGLTAKRAKGWLASRNRMAWFQRITGGMFIGLGVGLLRLKSVQS